MTTSTRVIDPAHIIDVTDFSPETLRLIVAHLEVSKEFEHLIYREAELDAVWSITGFSLMWGLMKDQRNTLTELHIGVHKAHDLVADGRPEEAAAVLRKFL
jgi:hypothetical protein